MPEMKQRNIRMSDNLYKAAEKMAKREKVSVGKFVRCAVDAYIDTMKWVVDGKGYVDLRSAKRDD